MVNLNRGSNNIIENDSIFKQDSLFVNSRDDPNISGIKKNKSPVNQTTATENSSQFKTIQPDDLHVRDSF